MTDNLPPLPRPRVAITGTSRGLGRALALAFAHAGADLLLHARSHADAVPVAAAARAAGARSVPVLGGDLGDPDLPSRLTAAATDALGGLDLLVLNAGVLGQMVPLADADLQTAGYVLQINVVRQLALVQAALPLLLDAPAGAVIWLSSGLGRFGVPGYGAYCASKHAAEGLMKVLAEEHADRGLVSVAVAPGMVQTDMLRAALGTDDVSEHQQPDATARAFVRLAAALGPEHNGASLDIAPWLDDPAS